MMIIMIVVVVVVIIIIIIIITIIINNNNIYRPASTFNFLAREVATTERLPKEEVGPRESLLGVLYNT